MLVAVKRDLGRYQVCLALILQARQQAYPVGSDCECCNDAIPFAHVYMHMHDVLGDKHSVKLHHA